MPDPAKLLQAALELPEADRASIAYELLVSLEAPDEGLEEWDAVIARRADEVAAGTVELSSVEDVVARARARFR